MLCGLSTLSCSTTVNQLFFLKLLHGAGDTRLGPARDGADLLRVEPRQLREAEQNNPFGARQSEGLLHLGHERTDEEIGHVADAIRGGDRVVLEDAIENEVKEVMLMMTDIVI